jgi:hypothetical protein
MPESLLVGPFGASIRYHSKRFTVSLSDTHLCSIRLNDYFFTAFFLAVPKVVSIVLPMYCSIALASSEWLPAG